VFDVRCYILYIILYYYYIYTYIYMYYILLLYIILLILYPLFLSSSSSPILHSSSIKGVLYLFNPNHSIRVGTSIYLFIFLSFFSLSLPSFPLGVYLGYLCVSHSSCLPFISVLLSPFFPILLNLFGSIPVSSSHSLIPLPFFCYCVRLMLF
jgi:hypothetical protein